MVNYAFLEVLCNLFLKTLILLAKKFIFIYNIILLFIKDFERFLIYFSELFNKTMFI